MDGELTIYKSVMIHSHPTNSSDKLEIIEMMFVVCTRLGTDLESIVITGCVSEWVVSVGGVSVSV